MQRGGKTVSPREHGLVMVWCALTDLDTRRIVTICLPLIWRNGVRRWKAFGLGRRRDA
jgi:hypothetical protein